MTDAQCDWIVDEIRKVGEKLDQLVALAERGQDNEDVVSLGAEVLEDVAAAMGYSNLVLGEKDPETPKPVVTLPLEPDHPTYDLVVPIDNSDYPDDGRGLE
jgi:hypothetical protein